MKRPPSQPNKVIQRIAELPELEWSALKALWKELFGQEPGINNRRYVERRLTHRLQEIAARDQHAELLQSNERRIRYLLQTGIVQPNKTKALRPGAVLTRTYRGVLHSVRALDDGRFEYGGKQYQSLSIIAREITGTRWSGPAFFGLRQPNQKKELP